MARSDGSRVAVAHALTHLAMAVAVVSFSDVREAKACGACFVSSSESTVVNDHRMALALSTKGTVLWDQITYSGNPKEFAYVIPVRAGTRVEVSNDEWFAALDASTRPIIMGPRPTYGGGGGGGGRDYAGSSGGGYDVVDNGGGGCGCGSEDVASSFSGGAGGADGSTSVDASASGSSQPPPDPVQVVGQEVVGSYETVTLRSDDPDALFKWLLANGFDVPDAARPIIGDYVKEGLDFLAMRLRPSASVRAMEPIRIVTPGADPTIPLRMMRIGAGAKLGITLFVIGEGRYHPANFPDAVIDPTKLVWDQTKNLSNYQSLSLEAMAQGNGRTWLTEYAQKPNLASTGSTGNTGMVGNPGLAAAYASVCPASAPYVPEDGGSFLHDAASDADENDAGDADVPDGDVADAQAPDASDDAGADADAGPAYVRTKRCDDLDVALTGLHPSDVWIVRMRANLPNEAMDTPLDLEPAPDQNPVDNVYQTTQFGVVSAGLFGIPNGRLGTYATILAAIGMVWSMLRRRSSGRWRARADRGN